jgi:hypothetical protein
MSLQSHIPAQTIISRSPLIQKSKEAFNIQPMYNTSCASRFPIYALGLIIPARKDEASLILH